MPRRRCAHKAGRRRASPLLSRARRTVCRRRKRRPFGLSSRRGSRCADFRCIRRRRRSSTARTIRRRRTYPNVKFDFLGYQFRPRRVATAQSKEYFCGYNPVVSPVALKSMRATIRRPGWVASSTACRCRKCARSFRRYHHPPAANHLSQPPARQGGPKPRLGSRLTPRSRWRSFRSIRVVFHP